MKYSLRTRILSWLLTLVMVIVLIPCHTIKTYAATELSGAGTVEDPYLINNTDDWDFFAQAIASGSNTYEGKIVVLTNDINVTTMAGKTVRSGGRFWGYDYFPFKGTFDGQGHTITVNYSGSVQNMGLFRSVKNAAIKNLTVDGTILISNVGTYASAGGLVGAVTESVLFENCRSAVKITVMNETVDTSSGGFLGAADQLNGSGGEENLRGTITFKNCVFDGEITSLRQTAGFVGWSEYGGVRGSYNITMENCLSLGIVNSASTHSFYRHRGETGIALSNNWYANQWTTKQGKCITPELTYNGEYQKLITEDEGFTGLIENAVYALGDADTPPSAESYSAGIPEGRDAQDYTIWFKIDMKKTDGGTLHSEGKMLTSIKKRPVTVTAKDQVILLNQAIETGAEKVSAELISGHRIASVNLTSSSSAVVTNSGEITPAGAVITDIDGNNVTNNYEITYAKGRLAVTDKVVQVITASNVTVTYGDTDKRVSAAVTEPVSGGAISYAVKAGSENYIDVNASTGALTIKNAGTATVIITAAETDTCLQATKEVTVTINRSGAVAVTVAANPHTYDGTEKPLLTVDDTTLTGGEMQYALGTDETSVPTSGWSASIPTATDIGTYYVWYKVVGDTNHVDSEAACVAVEINAPAQVPIIVVPPIVTPEPTASPEPTATPEPTDAPAPDETGEPTQDSDSGNEPSDPAGETTTDTPEPSDPTDGEDETPYRDVTIDEGFIRDITGTREATAESNPYETKIVNNSELKSLLRIADTEEDEGVNVWLDIQDISDTIPEEEKEQITEASTDGYTVALFLDASLFMKVGDNAPEKITETNGKIKVSIVIPEELRADGRSYEIIRLHDGAATVLQGVYDPEDYTFTFETDRFSAYAVAYKEQAGGTADSGEDTDAETLPQTGLRPVDVFYGLGLAWICYGAIVCLRDIWRRREENG